MSLSQLKKLLKDEFEYRLAFLTMKNGMSVKKNYTSDFSLLKLVN